MRGGPLVLLFWGWCTITKSARSFSNDPIEVFHSRNYRDAGKGLKIDGVRGIIHFLEFRA